MPSFWATTRTASGKVMPSIFCMKVKTSPLAPQPKQWKNWRLAWTEKDGVFSLVEGAEAGVVLRAGLAQLDVFADDADDVCLLLDGLREVSVGAHNSSVHRGSGWPAGKLHSRTGSHCGNAVRKAILALVACGRCGIMAEVPWAVKRAILGLKLYDTSHSVHRGNLP